MSILNKTRIILLKKVKQIKMIEYDDKIIEKVF